MDEALVGHLLASAGLSSLVGQRVSWMKRQRGAGLPAVVLHRIGADRSYTYESQSGLIASRIQVNCLGETVEDVKGVARAVISALSGFAGPPDGTGSPSGVMFYGVFANSERDLVDDGTAADEQVLGVAIDFEIWHLE